MRLSNPIAAFAIAVTAMSACVHRARIEQASPAAVLWPEPPAAAVVRYAFSIQALEDPSTDRWWTRLFRWIAGASDASGNSVFRRPFDVAMDAAGQLFVADPDSGRVVEFAADGRYLADLRCDGHAWSAPMAVAPGPDGTIFVADAGDATIVRWGAKGCSVSKPAKLQRPTGIAVSGDTLVVADPPAHQVLFLSLAGELLRTIGELGEGPQQFHFPSDVAVSPDGSVYVVDSLNYRIVHVSSAGEWLGSFGAAGESGGGFVRPKSLAIDASGRIFVTDAQRDQILVFRPDGEFLFALGAPGSPPGRFAHPAGLAVSATRLAVADSLNRSVQVFDFLGAPQ